MLMSIVNMGNQVNSEYAFDWVISSAGRAPPLQGGGRRFDPVITHHFKMTLNLVELKHNNVDW
jgi:hypothetical protein